MTLPDRIPVGRTVQIVALLLFVFLFSANESMADEAAGQRAYASGDYAAALHEWRKLAESGNAQAERDMGLLYATGHGVPQNLPRALRWYKRAAIHGDAQAMYEVGVIYENGRGVPPDAHRAAWWYRKAARHGSGPAAHSVALLYQRGEGVQKSQATAEHYFGIAAKDGVTDAPAQADASPGADDPLPLPPKPVPPPVAPDPELLRAQKLIMARGVTRIDARAIRALRTAALHGNAVAQYDLGFCYQNGFGVPADRTRAYVWYRRAVNSAAPAPILHAANSQARMLEAQLGQSQLTAAQTMLDAPPQ